jgi:two-component system, NarL family, sensor kinase
MNSTGFRISALLFFILFVIKDTPIAAQMITGLNKDSIIRLIKSTPDDTIKVDRFIVLGQQYENNVPDSAIYYYKQANELSRKLNYPKGIIRYINNYTAVLNVQGKFDESLKLNEAALALAAKNNLDEYRLKALINIGVVYQFKQDYQAAADHYLKHLPAFEQKADAKSLSIIYGNLCGLYRDLNQFDKNLEFAKKSLASAEESGQPYLLGRAYHNMANAFTALGMPKERQMYLHRAYELGQQLNDIELQETALINLADLFSQTAPPNQYIAMFRKALPLADSLGDVYGKALALQGISSGLFQSGKYREAEEMSRQTLAFAHDNELPETETKALLLMSDVKIAIGQLDSAKKYRHWYDSAYALVVNKELIQNVQKLETQYQVEKKQSQILKQDLLIEQKNREAIKQRTWLWILFAGLLVMGFFIFWGIRFYRQRQLLSRRELETLQAEQENLRLKSLLEGQLLERQRISQEMHDDMGSGLTSILFLSRSIPQQGETVTRLKNTAQQLIEKMNEIIWVMNQEQDTMDSLIAYIRSNVAEALDNAGMQFSFNTTEPLPQLMLNQEYRRNIYLSTKEAVHNCIKHSGGQHVDIRIMIRDRIEVVVTDDGNGLTDEKRRSAGNGLNNMRRRMEMIGGSFSIKAGTNGTTIILSAPLPV